MPITGPLARAAPAGRVARTPSGPCWRICRTRPWRCIRFLGMNGLEWSLFCVVMRVCFVLYFLGSLLVSSSPLLSLPLFDSLSHSHPSAPFLVSTLRTHPICHCHSDSRHAHTLVTRTQRLAQPHAPARLALPRKDYELRQTLQVSLPAQCHSILHSLSRTHTHASTHTHILSIVWEMIVILVLVFMQKHRLITCFCTYRF